VRRLPVATAAWSPPDARRSALQPLTSLPANHRLRPRPLTPQSVPPLVPGSVGLDVPTRVNRRGLFHLLTCSSHYLTFLFSKKNSEGLHRPPTLQGPSPSTAPSPSKASFCYFILALLYDLITLFTYVIPRRYWNCWRRFRTHLSRKLQKGVLWTFYAQPELH
jgi:hypothetical protein